MAAKKCVIDSKTDLDPVTISTSDNDINNWANDILNKYNINPRISTGFISLLMHLSYHIKFDFTDANKLWHYFNIYLDICKDCNIIPSVYNYCIMINLSYDTFNQWKGGYNRSDTHKNLCQKIFDTCKAATATDALKGSIGGIYGAKALYGLSDAPKPVALTQNNIYLNAPKSREAIRAELGIDIVDAEQPED